MTKPEFVSAEMGTRVTAPPCLLATGSIRRWASKVKLFRQSRSPSESNKTGIAVLFRYGVAVLMGFSSEDEIRFLAKLTPRIGGKLARFEEETAIVELAHEAEDQVQAGHRSSSKTCRRKGFLSSPTCWQRASCWPMTNAKWQRNRYSKSSNPLRKNWRITDVPEGIAKPMLRLIGNALLVQQRVSGRVAIGEKARCAMGSVPTWSGSMPG